MKDITDIGNQYAGYRPISYILSDQIGLFAVCGDDAFDAFGFYHAGGVVHEFAFAFAVGDGGADA
jgi:hypothetical protein